MTGLVPDENAGIGFTDEGWRSVGSKHTMPAALLDTPCGGGIQL